MQLQASSIVLYDFVFCIYVFLFAAGIIYCFFGIGRLGLNPHVHTSKHLLAALLNLPDF